MNRGCGAEIRWGRKERICDGVRAMISPRDIAWIGRAHESGIMRAEAVGGHLQSGLPMFALLHAGRKETTVSTKYVSVGSLAMMRVAAPSNGLDEEDCTNSVPCKYVSMPCSGVSL